MFIPVNQYHKEKKKEMIPNLNSQIVNLVDNLNDTSEIVQEEATVMLTYYGLDAIPVLLLRLERSESQSETMRLIQAIKSIHKHNPTGVLDEIYSSFTEEFERNYKQTDMDEISYYNNIYNYIVLLTELDLSGRERRGLEDLMDEFTDKLPDCGSNEFCGYFIEDLNTVCNHFSIDSVKIAR